MRKGRGNGRSAINRGGSGEMEKEINGKEVSKKRTRGRMEEVRAGERVCRQVRGQWAEENGIRQMKIEKKKEETEVKEDVKNIDEGIT